MARKTKFYFNPEELTYVLYKPRNWERVIRVSGIVASLSLIILLVYSIRLTQAKNPEEKKLVQQISFYKKQLEVMNKRIDQLQSPLNDLQTKDNEIYRVIFEADPISPSVTGAGTGGSNSYENLSMFPDADEIIATHKKLDKLDARISVLTASYEQLVKLAKRKQQMLASMPAIQPVSNADLNRIASGFGMRIHPIYKTPKMHEGIDFAAPKGTDVYVTGDGVVEKVEHDGGYGNHVVINHGFGFRTTYSHLSKCTVRKGQKVKRGEIIGLVGSTGLSTAPHLHYEVMKGGKKINPINYFHNDLDAGQYETIIELANRSNQSFD